tara:strand:+ start:258 stop:797 length:540 start_codon:yes stop_codon:yes gene_type:complete
MDESIYKLITLIKHKNVLKAFNYLTNNKDIIQILPNIYLGTVNGAHDKELLSDIKIDSIVNCTKDEKFHFYFDNKNKYRLYIEDSKNSDNMEYFSYEIHKAVEFIESEINSNNNVLVHCYWGLMRSPTVIAAYLIKKFDMTSDDAILFIKNKKYFTFSDIYNFKEILKKYEKYCKEFNI